MTDHHAYTAGLRALADLLDQNPEVPLPVYGSILDMLVIVQTSDPAALLAKVARLIPGTLTKDADDNYFRLRGQLHGLSITFAADREKVCRKVVKGIRTVTKPDPEWVAKVPLVTCEEEDVEWICPPLLTQSGRGAS